MDSIVNLLLLAGFGVILFVIVVAFIARGKKKSLHNTAAEQQRAESYHQGAPGADAPGEEK